MRFVVRNAFGAFFIAAGTSASCAAVTAQAPVVTPEGVRFSLAHAEARSVAVAGSFNDWSASAHPLARNGSGNVWTAMVVLPPGDHQFMFVLDGTQWIVPPLAEEYVDDGFGSRNGVISVRPRER